MAYRDPNIQKKALKRRVILYIIVGLFVAAAASSSLYFVFSGGQTDISEKRIEQSDAAAAGGNGDLVDSIGFEEGAMELAVGQKAVPKIKNGDISDMSEWESSDTQIVTVSDSGEITGEGVGIAAVTAKINDTGKSLSLTVRVSQSDGDGIHSGVTKNGFEIVDKDGLTYIGGILMASKTYTLPEDYAPGEDPEALEAFDRMQADASAEGLDIYIASGFRSYKDQDRIYNNYVDRDGKEAADTYSSRPGHSDHQTGLAFDLNSIDDSFGDTPESDWLKENAHKYGFIIRYPEGKADITGYQYEPWHIRYVGEEIASKLYESGLSVEEYLGVPSEYEEESEEDEESADSADDDDNVG